MKLNNNNINNIDKNIKKEFYTTEVYSIKKYLIN